MNYIDLHIHSNFSDGSYSPKELVQMARRKKMLAIAIADHDTIDQNKEALVEATRAKVDVITGVEVSAEFNPGTMHILGYFFDPDNQPLQTMLRLFKDGRDARNPKIVEKLNEQGVEITYEEVLHEAGGVTVGRPHIARVLITKGIVKNTEEAFNKFLAKGKCAYVNRTRLDSKTIISTLHNAGGIAVLAHPFQLKIDAFSELEKVIQQLTNEGLDGIEVFSSCHPAEKVPLYQKLAEQFDLVQTGGSDFHGFNKPDIEIGHIGGGAVVPPETINKMRSRIRS